MAFEIESKKLNLLIGASASTKYQTLIYEDRDSNNLICKCVLRNDEEYGVRRVPINSMDCNLDNRIRPYDSFIHNPIPTHDVSGVWAANFPISLMAKACSADNFNFFENEPLHVMTLERVTEAIINWILRIDLGQIPYARRCPYAYLYKIVSGVLQTQSFLVIAYPEIMLTPYSQSRLGVFLAVMANTRTLFVDTQSENLFNGIRVATARNLLNCDDATIVFYDDISSSFDYSDIRVLKLKPRGQLDAWPKNFYDQMEEDLGCLFQMAHKQNAESK